MIYKIIRKAVLDIFFEIKKLKTDLKNLDDEHMPLTMIYLQTKDLLIGWYDFREAFHCSKEGFSPVWESLDKL